jgi:hypothetical protein
VTWYKVGSGKIASNSSYTIESIAHEDAGSYECRAVNANGCTAKSVKTDITVNCKCHF